MSSWILGVLEVRAAGALKSSLRMDWKMCGSMVQITFQEPDSDGILIACQYGCSDTANITVRLVTCAGDTYCADDLVSGL